MVLIGSGRTDVYVREISDALLYRKLL